MRLGKLLDDAEHFDYETVRQVSLRTPLCLFHMLMGNFLVLILVRRPFSVNSELQWRIYSLDLILSLLPLQ